MSDIKQTWKLTDLDNDKSANVGFPVLEFACKELTNIGISDSLRITYLENDIEIEVVELTVYF